jgi:hypothetical protein
MSLEEISPQSLPDVLHGYTLRYGASYHGRKRKAS